MYKIENVTEADAGVYACVVGTDSAHAHLVAHLEVREEAPFATFAPSDGDSAKVSRVHRVQERLCHQAKKAGPKSVIF